MFVIKNTKTAYNCYLSKDGKWAGLLQAQRFTTQEEAKQALVENGEIRDYFELVGIKK